jgi:mono/diheme cytochrome c family protein
MKKRIIYVSLSVLLFSLLFGVAFFFGAARSGMVPVQADTQPSALEKKFFTMAVHASVARSAAREPVTDVSVGEDLQSGAEIYKAMCAQCHGQLSGKPSVLGAGFYPPAPQLPGHAITYSDAEVFWIIKHGIRNTAMPAWRNLLSDDDIKNVAAFVKQLNSPPQTNDSMPHPAQASAER